MEKKTNAVDLNRGLTTTQVQSRIERNLVNKDTTVPTKTIKQIIVSNVFTLFNFLNLGLAFAVFCVGSYKNLAFLGIVFCNTLISTIQEIHAKKIIDQLTLLSSKKATVLRSGTMLEIDCEEIVLDDIIDYKLGNQVVVDSIILQGECDVNESFITGESKPIHKKKGASLLSGSFIVSGAVRCQVEHVAEDNYTSKISKDAKYIKKVNSELMKSLNKIIKTVSTVIVPLGCFMFLKQISLAQNTLQDAVIGTVASLIGMIPEGLVLLTSTVLAVSVMRLAKSSVLVQELYCIETLARVDTLCLDKTGTITEGTLEVSDLIPCRGYEKEDVKEALTLLVSNLKDDNPTYQAVKEYCHKNIQGSILATLPFSSERKYSGVSLEEKGSYLMGAPEYLLQGRILEELKLEQYTEDYRVVLVCHSKLTIKEEKPALLEPLGILLISDKIRKTAPKTLAYFSEQGVDLKIISGDNPVTVASIAKRAGLKNVSFIDARTLKTEEEMKKALKEHNVFGRVSPMQKKQFVVILKSLGHIVAMTGDGVNDCLALKEADCSIAMASGSDAARNVSQLILLNSDFSSMPKVLLEGRRTINNIQRSATLFLTKTVYSTLLAILFLFLSSPYPFVPVHLTLTSVSTIGIPAFILALEPNKKRVEGNFLWNVVSKAVPTALTIVLQILLIIFLGTYLAFNQDQISTICVVMTAYTSFLLLYRISKPLNLLRGVLLVSMIALFLNGGLIFQKFFSLTSFTTPMFLTTACLMTISIFIHTVLSNCTIKILKQHHFK